MLVTIDTQQIHKHLIEGGFDEAQADALIEVVRQIDLSHLVTKDDLSREIGSLRGDMEKMEGSLRGDMEKMEGSLRADMEKMESRLLKEISVLRDDMKEREINMMKWLLPLLLAQAGLIVALMKLL